MPRYSELSDKQRLEEYDKEKNITMYLSSAWWQDSWAFTKCKDAFQAMMDDTKHQFVCGLPYQLSIKEGLLDRELVEDEMLETDFNEIKFSMEYEALFYGSNDGSFFDFDSISKNRKIKYPMLPDAVAARINNSNLKIQPKQNGEIRILSADIALMSSKKNNNDATAIFINCMQPTKTGRYTSNIVYAETFEGLHTSDQALVIRKMFDEFGCDYLVIDTNGLGLGVCDALMRDIVDTETGQIYPAISCCNDKVMADRCTATNAAKVIWSVKASANFNSDIAFLLREGFRSGRVRLLVSEYDAEELLGEMKGYSSLLLPEKTKLQLPYINTTLLIDELIKLRHEEVNGKVKIYERYGMRKDRYSSLAYNYYVATVIESRAGKQSRMSFDTDEFVCKTPNYNRKVGDVSGRRRNLDWRG